MQALHISSRRVLLGIVPVALAVVVLAAAPAKLAADDVAQNIVPIADLVGSLPGLPPRLPDRPSSAERNNVPLFFGFLEFDWDPNAPGGVPGFDLWAADEARSVAALPRIGAPASAPRKSAPAQGQ